MHALIVLAHPEAKSFNAQMAQVAKAAFEAQGHTAEISDLYGEGFDAREAAPRLRANAFTGIRACARLRSAGRRGG